MRSPFIEVGAGRQIAAPAPVTLQLVPAAATSTAVRETADLRRLPIYKDPADLLAYERRKATDKSSDALPIGTQARFLAAALAAAGDGKPLNTLLTLRWTSLFSDGDVNWLRCMPIPERIDTLVERLRKWLTHRGVPPFYIWVREAAGPEGEHWHSALDLPRDFSSICDESPTQREDGR